MENTSTSLTEIIDSLSAWESIRQTPLAMVAQFRQGNIFRFTYPASSVFDFIHVYPGVDNGVLTFFVIPAQYDSPDTRNIEDYVQKCPINNTLPGSEIDPTEAGVRIADWLLHFPTWVPAQAATDDGVYQAFCVPGDDLQAENYTAYLALKPEDTDPTGYTADLIIDDGSNAQTFFDTVRPVPPFKPYRLQDFYLLTLC